MYTTCWQDEADLNIDVQILYIKAGKSEIQNYVTTVAQPSLDQYAVAAQNAAARAAGSATDAANSATAAANSATVAANSATAAANSATVAADVVRNALVNYYTKTQIDGMIGSIGNVLDNINGEIV